MGMPALVYRWYFRAHSLKSLERNVLGFVGMSPVRHTLVGSVEGLGEAGVRKWKAKLRTMGSLAHWLTSSLVSPVAPQCTTGWSIAPVPGGEGVHPLIADPAARATRRDGPPRIVQIRSACGPSVPPPCTLQVACPEIAAACGYHSRADLSGGTSHEDAFHCQTITTAPDDVGIAKASIEMTFALSSALPCTTSRYLWPKRSARSACIRFHSVS